LTQDPVAVVDENTSEGSRLTLKDRAWLMAKKLMTDYHFVTLSDTEEMLYYADGVYKPGAEGIIKRTIQEGAKDDIDKAAISKHLVEETIAHIQRSTLTDRNIFGGHSEHLVLENCRLNLDTMEVESHSSDLYFLNKQPVRYEPTSSCPKFTKFLSEVVHPEDKAVVQEIFGSCLTSHYRTQKAILLVGEGDNGKSTLLKVLENILGSENISAVSLQELEINRFAKADLYGKLANIYADLPNSALKCAGQFKMLTGGDPIRGERKFRDSFHFNNYAKLIFSCNQVPEVYEDTNAFFRRWIIINFPNNFEGKKADKDLLTKLTTPEELSGILNWAIEGYRRLRDNGWRFSNSRSTAELRVDYIRRSSPIRAFLLDCTEFSPQARTVKKELFQSFVRYCMKNKLSAVTSDTLFKNLPLYLDRELQSSREDVNNDGKRETCFIGLRVRPEQDWGQILEETEPEEPEEKIEEKLQKTLDSPDSHVIVTPVSPVIGSNYLSSHEDWYRAICGLRLREVDDYGNYLTGNGVARQEAASFVTHLQKSGKFQRAPDGFLELVSGGQA